MSTIRPKSDYPERVGPIVKKPSRRSDFTPESRHSKPNYLPAKDQDPIARLKNLARTLSLLAMVTAINLTRTQYDSA